MAMKKSSGGKSGKDKKAERGKRVKKTRKVYTLYEVSGDTIKRKNKMSPKSPGDFLAKHKDRDTCGKTGYTEFKSKATVEKKEE
jgi:ubiquitin-small subunit ribosomal protein S27Ae